jgi:RHS repeat-associated protein
VANRRIGKSTNGTQTWFAYDGQNTFADFNSGGSLTNRYLYGLAIDQLFAKYASSTTSWYLTDKIGSVRQLANTAGTLLDSLTYDTFGNMLSESSPSNGDRFKYTSREWDSEIALQFNRARYYTPTDGRWISEDPRGFVAKDANLYRYVLNNPVGFADPSGLEIPGPRYDPFLQRAPKCVRWGPPWYSQMRYPSLLECAHKLYGERPAWHLPTSLGLGVIGFVAPWVGASALAANLIGFDYALALCSRRECLEWRSDPG